MLGSAGQKCDVEFKDTAVATTGLDGVSITLPLTVSSFP